MMRPLLRSEGFHWKDVWATYDVDNDGSVGEAEFVRFYKETVAPVIYESSEDHGTARWRQNISQGKSSAPSVSDPFPVLEVSPMNALLNSPPQAGQEQETLLTEGDAAVLSHLTFEFVRVIMVFNSYWLFKHFCPEKKK